ncbi:LarC family nickel insertion protein [Ferrimicrobium acidiphilum]|uniref:LarC family nickel insertion protein n=1 Tax=Ferrimicrobium acidiphilum TaxID=121039 RepID=UPI0023F273A8|nr:LarC family nickel insertion protein [Ferrimicrobium acidiphilum]
MRTLLINPAHGVAGDMLMAALAEATHSFNELETLFAPLSRWCSLEFEEVDRSSLRAIHCQVKLTPDAPSLSLGELRSWIGELLDASNGVEIAMTALDLIAAAEVEVHGGGVHLHELASVDTLVDLVGTAYLCAIARIDAISIMPVGINFGSMEMAHGQLPLPGPAVLSLLAKAGLQVVAGPGDESVTPTGAALLSSLAGVFPAGTGTGTIVGVGYGAGIRDTPSLANVCQVVIVDDLATVASAPWFESIGVIETYLDDVSAELLGAFVQESLGVGALDAYVTPATGKKSRPGGVLTVLVDPSDLATMVTRVQRSLGVPGVRFRLQQRSRLHPKFVEVKFEGHTLMVKVTSVGAKPEFEDLQRVGRELGIPLGELRDRVMAVYLAGVAHSGEVEH